MKKIKESVTAVSPISSARRSGGRLPANGRATASEEHSVLSPLPWDGKERREERIRLADMGQLAASIAHELRQPLGAIQNFAYCLKSAVSPADPKAQECLQLLEQQAELAARILSNLVAFGRSGTPHRTSISLDEVLGEVLKRFRLPNEIRLQIRLAPRLPLVYADPLHVDRILSNLIANALESMEGPGTLCIAARTEPASRNGTGSGKSLRQRDVVLEITDTGCGIHADQTGDIFRAFATTKPSGTGLGLALCRQLAEANGGSITFKSSPGEGTSFELRLPQV